MLERNIKLYEPGELLVFLTISGMYYLGVSEKYNFFERFDYDMNVFIIVSVIYLSLCNFLWHSVRPKDQGIILKLGQLLQCL